MKDRDNWHITEEIKHETGSGDPFAAAVRATRMPMVITDPAQPDNPIIFCNEAFQRLTGYDRDEVIGRNCRFLQGEATDAASVMRIREAVAAGQSIDIDLLNYRKDGSTFWNALYLSPVHNASGDIQFFFASQLDVTDRVSAQETITEQNVLFEREVERRTRDLQAALEEKTLLLHEVDHRVKNNLTMIGSLLRLQARTIGDPLIASKLEAMLERVDALATVHRRLYQSDDVTQFDIGAFTENLVSDVIGASGRGEIEVRVKVDKILISSGKAAALGLVLNEVLTNAVKHAYPEGRAGTLEVAAEQDGAQARISIRDDGPGLDGEAPRAGGLGATLIKRLSKQVGAQVTWRNAAPGTLVAIAFSIGTP
ncbi:PAS domain-containing protein [Sphingobium sp. Z007]|uniref:PAS domain-containing protein n=1 Tax=Sphingobium sp. Z007 TaxID=627495 RepID=UPI000B49D91A|nr:PAS domain-containing protein [Sphingobium sp. Z007]